jgi:hypothetical protein
MSLPGLLFALLLALFVLAWIVMPLLGRDDARTDAAPPEKQRERLLTYYERVLRNIRDLDEDHALGKIEDDEYTTEREAWAQRGAQVLEALDALGGEKPTAAAPAPAPAAASTRQKPADGTLDDAIEDAVKRYRQRKVQ